ncbi:hypothetical protein [Bacillus swezeyi]|uniref:Uncharacterized protein n=1 Tax=Bacillus swezeyi TaxID=1925020 RepID=A0A5M8RJC5_9BACI|nr:hypothetical protein [Bacillus swezeyi]KAA6446944.1 hypothetical protein DX927_23115 [Bacillus swezeyi]KAA6471512.1 hypothetical protein DX928_23355 [Bacillus swezeyi]
MKRLGAGLVLLIISLQLPQKIYAAESPPYLQQGGASNKPGFAETISNATQSINSYAPIMSFILSAVFTIMFLIGVIRLAYSIITKTGSVLKHSTSMLLWVPVAFILIRIGSIIMFTTNGSNDILIASDIIHLLQVTGYFAAIGMILVGLIMLLFFKFLEHPDFGRWFKRLNVVSIILICLSTIMPVVLNGI